MFTKEEKEKIKEVNNLFDKIEDILLSLNPETQEKILEYHNEDSSLQYCVRWGLQGSEELLREK